MGAVLIYGLLGFFLAPYLLEKNLVETLQRNYDAELRVDRIEINPFALSLRVEGLSLDNPDGKPTIKVGEAYANFQLSSIFRRALTFDQVRISSAELFAARDAAGNLDFAYLTNSTDEAAAEAAPADDEDTALPQLLIFDFRLEDWFVRWTDQIPGEPVETRFGPISVAIEELNTLPDRSGQQDVTIAMESAGILRWSGELQLNPVRISGQARLENFHFPLVSAYLRSQAGVEIVDGSSDVQLDFEVYATDRGQVAARVTNFDLALANLVIDSFADGIGFDFAGEDRQILSLPGVRVTAGRFQWPEKIVALGSLSIDQPRIEVVRDEGGVFSLEPRQADNAGAQSTPATNESVAGADATGSPGDPWQFSLDSLAVNDLALDLLDRSVTPETTLGVSDFDLQIGEISNQPEKRFPTTLSLQATTGGKLTLQGEVALLPTLLFDLAAKAETIQLAGANPYVSQAANLNLKSGAVNVDGRIAGTAEETFSFTGDVGIADLDIAESIDGTRLLGWKNFLAQKVALRLAGRHLDVSRLRFDELYGDIQINQDGSLNLAQVKKDGASTTPAEPTVADAGSGTEEESTPFETRIGEIVVADTTVDFADLALPLPFAAKISALNGKITTISSTSNEPAEVAFEGKVGEYGLARIGGTVTPLDPADNTDLQVSFENIEMPGFTPYSIPFAGREIASGILDLKLGYQVKNKQLVGENSIVLRDFELGKEVPHPDALDLPLGLAVALLKDSEGKIDIELPVRGDLDEPEFSFGGVIRSALGKLIARVVLSPFTALASLLGIESDELAQIRFDPGRADLTPPEMEKAAKLAEALGLRPKLQLVVAGVFDPAADGRALRTAQFDAMLAQRIAELEATSDASVQLADLRRMALERMYAEQLAAGTVTRTLDDWQIEFTAPVEDQAEPRLDRLAYANELRQQLIGLQSIDAVALAGLATARAEALQTAILAADATLQERVSIADNVEVERKDSEAVEMELKLTAG